MGKEYASELRSMAETYAWARALPIPALAEFARRSAPVPLIAVWAGGSVTAAEFASMLHPAVSRTMTTEEFLENNIPHDCAVLLISDGGKDHDILAAYGKAVKAKPKALGIVCANAASKLAITAASNQDVLMHAATLPTGRDGFLATNTLLATIAWIMTAWGCSLPNSLHEAAYKGSSIDLIRYYFPSLFALLFRPVSVRLPVLPATTAFEHMEKHPRRSHGSGSTPSKPCASRTCL